MPHMDSAVLLGASWWNSTRGTLATDRSRAAGPTRDVRANASIAATFGSHEFCVPQYDHTWQPPPATGRLEGAFALMGRLRRC